MTSEDYRKQIDEVLAVMEPGLKKRHALEFKAMFQYCGVFAEFERSIIRKRIKAGLTRAKGTESSWDEPGWILRGKMRFGRPWVERTKGVGRLRGRWG